MSAQYDLHTHSTASDGTLTPEALVLRARDLGIEVLGLTDHDTTDGIAEAKATAEQVGVLLIPGIELSVTWNKRVVHLVGLGIDPAGEALVNGLIRLREFRQWRAEEIGRRLEKEGISGAYEGAKALSNGQLISRTHFGRFLVNQGYAQDARKVFKKFLTRGKPGHVPGDWASLADAVSWIRQAGGQAVVAHPARYGLTRSKLRRLISEFVDAGGEALEVVSGSHSRDENFTMARHAKDFGLLGSAGSDYHGPETPWIELGRVSPLPDGTTPIWHNWLHS
ncbi:MAG: PHP domain-containing protein [Sedimenticola sp.]